MRKREKERAIGWGPCLLSGPGRDRNIAGDMQVMQVTHVQGVPWQRTQVGSVTQG